MRNLKIGAKIIIGFGSVMLFLLIITATMFAATSRTLTNIDNIECYSGLQFNANALMNIYNETRMTARELYRAPSENACADLDKQLQYCDKRIELLYEYIGRFPQIASYNERVNAFETQYRAWCADVERVNEGYAALGEAPAADAADAANEQASLVELTRKEELVAQETLAWAILDIDALVQAQVSDTTFSGNSSLIIVLAISAVSLVVALIMALTILRAITRPMERMRTVFAQIGQQGDLNIAPALLAQVQRDAGGRDETAHCAGAFLMLLGRLSELSEILTRVADGNLVAKFRLLSGSDQMGLAIEKMLGNLNDKFFTISQSSAQVHSGAMQLSSSAQELSIASSEQASAVERLSGSIEEVTEKAQTNTSLAAEAAKLTTDIRDSAQKGSQQMDMMMQAVEDINAASQSISKIIKVIDDIAFQTNILALNAAVEAARAGQHGKGFAVVAEEVRNLAAKSAEAAKDTSSLIENSMQKAALGASIAKETASSLAQIVAGIRQSGTIMDDIVQFSTAQSSSVMMIRDGIASVAQVVQQTSSTSGTSASAAQEIAGEAAMLEQMMAQFTIEGRDKELGDGGYERRLLR